MHFHWDRHDQSNENSSCWMRVSQAWAGKNWGSIQIPRIGQEVIVSFLEGDPDRPIITARPCQGRGREFESRFPLQILQPGFGGVGES